MEHTKVQISNASSAITAGNKTLNTFTNEPSPFTNNSAINSLINSGLMSGDNKLFTNFEKRNEELAKKTEKVLEALKIGLGNMETLNSEQSAFFDKQEEELVKFSGATFTGIDGKEVGVIGDGKLDVIPDIGGDGTINPGTSGGGYPEKTPIVNPGDNHGENNGNNNNEEEPTEEPPILIKVNNKVLQEKEYDKLGLDGFLKIHAAILAHAENQKFTISDLLFDPKYALELKELMLANPNISKELKELIENGDDDITQKILSEVFMGKNKEMFGINNMTSKTIKNYLTSIAENNDVSLKKLLSDSKYEKDVREAITDYENAAKYVDNIKSTDQKTEYLKIYDGDSIERVESSTMDIVRDSLENAASDARKTVVEYLDSAKIDDHTSGLSNSSKLLGFAKSFNVEKMYELLNKIVN